MPQPASLPRPRPPRRPSLAERFVAAANTRGILAGIVLLEIVGTALVPFPYEALFVALCLAAPRRILAFTAASVIGSVIGGSIVYAVGAGLAGPVASWLDVSAQVAAYGPTFEARGGVLVFLGGFTPLPSYLVNLAAGATGYPFPAFVALFTASRIVRYGVLALGAHLLGEAILHRWAAMPAWLRATVAGVLVVLVGAWSLAPFL